jgi:hypothetical protein
VAETLRVDVIENHMLLARKIAISSVKNPNMVRNERDFEMIIIAQGQKKNIAWVVFALIQKI